MHTYITYITSALISFVIDITLFNIFLILTTRIPYAIVFSSFLARFVSSLVNYYLNKYFVFKYKKEDKKAIFKYFLLVLINITISSLLVEFIYSILRFNATVIKVIIDILIFISNFLIQKFWIFKNK